MSASLLDAKFGIAKITFKGLSGPSDSFLAWLTVRVALELYKLWKGAL